MDKLDVVNKDLHVGQEIIAKKKQEDKFLVSGKRPFKGAKLFALDMQKREVYEVDINIKEPIVKVMGVKPGDFTKSAKGRAVVNPHHPTIWTSNAKTALKKFKKMRFTV